MPTEFVKTELQVLLALLRDLTGRQAGRVRPGTRDDLCDLAVTRMLVEQLERDGMTVVELARLGDSLRCLADDMHHARAMSPAISAADGLQWSYTSLFVRTLALALSERVAGHVGWDPEPEIPTIADELRLGDTALDLLAAAVTRDAVDQLLGAVQRSVEICSGRRVAS